MEPDGIVAMVELLGKAWNLHKKGALTIQEYIALKESVLLRIIGIGNDELYENNTERDAGR